MKLKPLLILAFATGLVATAQAQKCPVCEQPFGDTTYVGHDRVSDEQIQICDRCLTLNTRCFLCSMPAKLGIRTLNDGRVLCARDAKGVILDEAEAREVFAEARGELARVYARFLSFPETNVTVELADASQMEQIFQKPGFERQCPSVWGYIRSRLVQDGSYRHPITILGGLPRHHLMAIFAHELTHAWLNENVKPERALDRDAAEGFCELIAYKLMDALRQETIKKTIRANDYSAGQIRLFIEADGVYGLNRILEWVKHGEDFRLSDEELDRIRRLKAAPAAPAPAYTGPPIQGAFAYRDTLTLMGITGTGSRRLALINNQPFAEQELGKIRVGTNRITIRCLEIRTNSVLVEVEGSTEKRELFLKEN